MRFWFSRDPEVPLREQLVRQVVLGILSNDLHPGERLPSTRELARRFRLHPNTVSAAYRQLERDGWADSRRGSGVYVGHVLPDSAADVSIATAHQLIAGLVRNARMQGVSLASLRDSLREWLSRNVPDRFLLIEDDSELRKILAEEIRAAVSLPVESIATSNRRLRECRHDVVAVCLHNHEDKVRTALPPNVELMSLQVRSVGASLAPWLPVSDGKLVGVASRWPNFLEIAQTMLVAAGLNTNSLLVRDARKSNWRRGLDVADAIVCDTVTCSELSTKVRAIVFPLLSPASLEELRSCERFLKPASGHRL